MQHQFFLGLEPIGAAVVSMYRDFAILSATEQIFAVSAKIECSNAPRMGKEVTVIIKSTIGVIHHHRFVPTRRHQVIAIGTKSDLFNQIPVIQQAKALNAKTVSILNAVGLAVSGRQNKKGENQRT
jgi:hypothetical protein